VSFPDIVKYAGGTPVFVETKPEGGFSVKAPSIEKNHHSEDRLLVLIRRAIPRRRRSAETSSSASCGLQEAQRLADGRECYSHFTYEPPSRTRSPAQRYRKKRHHHRLSFEKRSR